MNSFAAGAHHEQASAATLTTLYQISSADRDRLRKLGKTILPKIETYVAGFYIWLEKQPEFDRFFTSPEKLARVKALQVDYWTDFFQGDLGEGYVGRRRSLGEVHARILLVHADTEHLAQHELVPRGPADAPGLVARVRHPDAEPHVEQRHEETDRARAGRLRIGIHRRTRHGERGWSVAGVDARVERGETADRAPVAVELEPHDPATAVGAALQRHEAIPVRPQVFDAQQW